MTTPTIPAARPTRVDGWLPRVPNVHSLMWMPPPPSFAVLRIPPLPVVPLDGPQRCNSCPA